MNQEDDYVKVNFFDYFRDCYVYVNDDFRRRILSEARSSAGSWRSLSKILGAAGRMVVANWKNHKSYRKRKLGFETLTKCCRLAGIPELELIENINCATMRYPAGEIAVDAWKLILNENFAEWLGMLNGDGSVTDRSVKFSNTHFDLVLYFADFLEKTFFIKKERIKMAVSYYTDESFRAAKDVVARMAKMGYRVKLYRVYNHKGKKIVLTTSVDFRVLSQFLLNLKKSLNDLIRSSPNSVKAAYLAGFSAAEGCASESKAHVRIITITQNDTEELHFIKSLLNEIGIKNVDGPRSTGTAYRLGITTQRNLEKFSQLVGFGKHEDKNKKLKEMISHYKFSVYRKGS